MSEVVAGQTTEVFKRMLLREGGFSFSLKYTDDDGARRTLDLTCPDASAYEAWYTGLRVVVERLRSSATPAVPAAAAFMASAGGGDAGGGSLPAALVTAAELSRCFGGGTAVVSWSFYPANRSD